MRDDIKVVGRKMAKHSDECAHHLQAQNTVSVSSNNKRKGFYHFSQTKIHLGARSTRTCTCTVYIMQHACMPVLMYN